MKTYSRAIDLMIHAAAFAQKGQHEKAAARLIKATQEPDFDESIEQLNDLQEENLQQQQQQPQQMSTAKLGTKALARALARLGKKTQADVDDLGQQVDQDLSDDELDLGLDEQAGIDDMDSDTVADEDEFTIETAGDGDDDEDDQQQQQQQQQQSSVRRARAAANARLLRK